MDDFEKRVSLLEAAAGRNEERIAKHGEEIDRLRLDREHDSVVLANVNATCLEIKAKLDEQDRRLTNEESRPARRWEQVVSTVINSLTLAVMAYMLARLGLS